MRRSGVSAGVVLCLIVNLVGQQSAAQVVEGPPGMSLPPDPISFQQGLGSNIAGSYCLICHSAEYIYTQPPHPKERWAEIVQKMKHAFGCPIPDEDIPPLVDYLVSQNATQPTPGVPTVQEEVTKKPSGQLRDQAGDPGRGARVFGKYCVNCHGSRGKGDGPIGQSLVPPAANLTVLSKKYDKDILETIRKGRPGTAMPPWQYDLSAQEIRDVLAYIRTLGS